MGHQTRQGAVLKLKHPLGSRRRPGRPGNAGLPPAITYSAKAIVRRRSFVSNKDGYAWCGISPMAVP